MLGLGLGPAQSEQGRGIGPRSSPKLPSVLRGVSPCAEPGRTRAGSALQGRLGWCTSGQPQGRVFSKGLFPLSEQGLGQVPAGFLFLPDSL